MTFGIWILGDQLHFNQAAIASALTSQSPQTTPVLMVESHDWVRQRNYHKQKLVLVWSAMRHFAEDLKAKGFEVTYRRAETFEAALQEFASATKIDELRVMEPADLPMRSLLTDVSERLDISVVQLPNNHYLWSRQEFSEWTTNRKRLVMEDFYRAGRKRFGILMDGDDPVGDRWNFDKDNRKPPKTDLNVPEPLRFEPDSMTQAAIEDVESEYSDNFGSLTQFQWAVTRDQALQVLEQFVRDRISSFGPYQDAMVTGQPTMWHALISPYLNIGLLQPLEVIQSIEKAHVERQAPIASVEGAIRQVLGWREYVRGLYEIYMPEGYSDRNWFDHQRPLPDFFWTGETDMNCLRQSLQQTIESGYAHHIQRLMVLGNFALISGINPQALESWFHSAFIDSYDWVMQTNVLGMSVFADGGLLATKPYAASANYIHKMSDYCCDCRYNWKNKTGNDACPFNFFYWDFLHRHERKLADLGRMGLVLANLARLSPQQLAEIGDRAQGWWELQMSSQSGNLASSSASSP
ncbi:MAG: cryptochrome/photolyase family protein [Cyanobacteria bacterium J06639_1]